MRPVARAISRRLTIKPLADNQYLMAPQRLLFLAMRVLQMPLAYQWTWRWTLAATLCAAIVLWSTGGTIAPGGAIAILAVLAPLLGAHWLYRTARPDRALADLTGALVAISWTMMMTGVISLMGVRLGAPLIDDALARADALLGLHPGGLVIWTAEHPSVGAIFGFAYLSSFPLLFATIVHLALARRSERLWRFVGAIAASMTIATAFSAAAPALGAFTHHNFSEATIRGLPAGSGLYHLQAFEAYRSGVWNTIDFGRLQGVVTFPSIHTCLALAVAYAYYDDRLLRWPSIAWNGLVIVSTIPIGGHYYVDLIAGAAMFAVIVAILSRTPVRAAAPCASWREPNGELTPRVE